MPGLKTEAIESLARVHIGLRGGIPITDADLSRAIPLYINAMDFFRALCDKKYELTVNSLREDLMKLQEYKEARKSSN
jgi:hypothetical protein